MELLGTIGATAFAVVSLPILIDCIKNKSSKNVSWSYLILSLIGNISTYSYVIYTSIITGVFLLPLYLNYTCALIITIILTVLKCKMNKMK